ncbi:MAG: hypothetical protein WAQ99_11135 [Pyrinomonadaceae bacterium]
MSLQEGIFHESGTTPPPNFGIMFLRVSQGAPAADVGNCLASLWKVFEDLQEGKVRDLPGITVPPGDLKLLIGYGPNCFKLPNVRHPLPQGLGPQNRFRSVGPGGGNRLLLGGGLSYEEGLTRNPATEEIMVQFLGNTPLVVNRPMLETWKILRSNINPETGTPLLQITAFYMGFHREDRRSWIDFHDGVSNPIKGDQRLSVVRIKETNTSQADAWTRGGSYMTFMRLPIDVELWNQLSREQQELLVGRDKLSGCPFQSAVAPFPVNGCPIPATAEVTDKGNEEFREPPDGVDEVIKKSHVQRANHHRQEFENPDSLRIYRQGYEFAESVQNGIPRVGLNFVAFHDTPSRVIEMLSLPDWLGGVNFGGEISASSTLIRVAGAGIYLVPPLKDGQSFPGTDIFL